MIIQGPNASNHSSPSSPIANCMLDLAATETFHFICLSPVSEQYASVVVLDPATNVHAQSETRHGDVVFAILVLLCISIMAFTASRLIQMLCRACVWTLFIVNFVFFPYISQGPGDTNHGSTLFNRTNQTNSSSCISTYSIYMPPLEVHSSQTAQNIAYPYPFVITAFILNSDPNYWQTELIHKRTTRLILVALAWIMWAVSLLSKNLESSDAIVMWVPLGVFWFYIHVGPIMQLVANNSNVGKKNEKGIDLETGSPGLKEMVDVVGKHDGGSINEGYHKLNLEEYGENGDMGLVHIPKIDQIYNEFFGL